MKFPLQFTFKITTISNDFRVHDADGVQRDREQDEGQCQSPVEHVDCSLSGAAVDVGAVVSGKGRGVGGRQCRCACPRR